MVGSITDGYSPRYTLDPCASKWSVYCQVLLDDNQTLLCGYKELSQPQGTCPYRTLSSSSICGRPTDGSNQICDNKTFYSLKPGKYNLPDIIGARDGVGSSGWSRFFQWGRSTNGQPFEVGLQKTGWLGNGRQVNDREDFDYIGDVVDYNGGTVRYTYSRQLNLRRPNGNQDAAQLSNQVTITLTDQHLLAGSYIVVLSPTFCGNMINASFSRSLPNTVYEWTFYSSRLAGSGSNITFNAGSNLGPKEFSVKVKSTDGSFPDYTVTQTIYVGSRIEASNMSLNPNPVVASCETYTSLNAKWYADYDWNVPGAVFDNNSNKTPNCGIKYFTTSGSTTAQDYTLTISPKAGTCGSAQTYKGKIIVNPKTAGPLLDNNKNTTVGDVYPSSTGQYSLRLQQLINGASYVWELPNAYSIVGSTPTVSMKTKTETSGQVYDNFPINSLVDFNGKVTVTGVCGSQIFPFTIKARQTATLPSIVRTCALTAIIPINNPQNAILDAVWMESSGATVSKSGNDALIRITDAGEASIYRVGVSLRDVGNLYSNVLYQPGAGVWASGTLADERRDVGSNLALASGRKIYFTTRDGKMWYYEYSNGLGKWDVLPVSAVTSAKVIPNGYSDVVEVNSLICYIESTSEIYYVENGIKKPYGLQSATKLYTPTNSTYYGLFFRQPDGVIKFGDINGLVRLTNISNTDDERFLVDNNTIYYVKGGYLYQATIGNASSETLLVSSKTILSGTDLEIYGVDLYFTGSDKILYKVNRITKVSTPLTSAGYCEGQFAINQQTGVIYVKTKDPNTSYYRMGQVYQQGASWLVKNATNSVARPNDYTDGDIIFNTPNVFYVSARNKPNYEGESINSVWNLYFFDQCTPAVFRKGDEAEEATASTSSNTQSLAYPNPFANELLVPTLQGQTVQLYDQLGRILLEKRAEESITRIQTNELGKGVYVLKLSENGNVIATQKLVK